MPLQSNTGSLPEACTVRDEYGEIASYRKVHVVLFGGYSSRAAGHAPWPAAGARPPTDWGIRKPPHDFDICEWEIA